MTYAWFTIAALSEIGGCFAFWLWLRSGRGAWLVLQGLAALLVFAIALTRVPADHAGRAFAAYGGIYIAASLLWLWLVEGTRPDRFDVLGLAFCLLGSGIILFGPRGQG